MEEIRSEERAAIFRIRVLKKELKVSHNCCTSNNRTSTISWCGRVCSDHGRTSLGVYTGFYLGFGVWEEAGADSGFCKGVETA